MVLEADLPHLAPDSQQEWVDRAVALARCSSTRTDLAEQVIQRAPALFHDTRSVRALEALFETGLPS
jgi:predicted O-linked N-acetylglucosamine transferase (SPINDLY family)